jgi:hypothetical protein
VVPPAVFELVFLGALVLAAFFIGRCTADIKLHLRGDITPQGLQVRRVKLTRSRFSDDGAGELAGDRRSFGTR